MRNILTASYGRKFIFFLVLTFFWYSADTILTYLTPVLVEERESNLLLLGLIVSLGSVAGIAADLASSWLFNDRHFPFFYTAGFIIALLVPVFLPFEGVLPIILLIMLGGMQFELFSFGQEDYLSHHIERRHQILVSSLITVVVTIASLAVPFIINPYLESLSFQFPFVLYIVLMLCGFLYFFMFRPAKRKDRESVAQKRVGFINELRIWTLLTKKTGSVFIVMLTMMFLDAVFWTLGPLLTFQYAAEQGGELAGLFIPMYMLPGLFVSVYAPRIGNKLGELKASIVTLLLSGVVLVLFLVTDNIALLLLFTFMSSVFNSATLPLIEGVLAHLISRLGDDGGHLIGLRGFATDIGYIIGPIFSGVIAQFFGIREGFGFLGVVVIFVCMVLLIRQQKTIRLPKKQLHDLEEGFV